MPRMPGARTERAGFPAVAVTGKEKGGIMDKINKKEFSENRTSWKFFKRKIDLLHNPDFESDNYGSSIAIVRMLLLEILKELQHLNG